MGAGHSSLRGEFRKPAWESGVECLDLRKLFGIIALPSKIPVVRHNYDFYLGASDDLK